MTSWRLRFHDKWPHLASLYASTHNLDEEGKHPDPMMGQDNVFDPSEPYGAYRYYVQPSARSEFSIEEPVYINRPVYKDEESRSSDYTSGDSFRRGNTCRVLLCVFLVFCFIAVVVAAITLAVLLSQGPSFSSRTKAPVEKFESSIRIDRDFEEALSDPSSDAFKALEKEICDVIGVMFTDYDSPFRNEYTGCEVMEITNGSIVVRYRLSLQPKVPEGYKDTDRINQKIEEYFKQRLRENGPWRRLGIDARFLRRFLKVSVTTTQKPEETTTEMATTPAIIEDDTTAVSSELETTTIQPEVIQDVSTTIGTDVTTASEMEEITTSKELIKDLTTTKIQETTPDKMIPEEITTESDVFMSTGAHTFTKSIVETQPTVGKTVKITTATVSTELPQTSAVEVASSTSAEIPDMTTPGATKSIPESTETSTEQSVTERSVTTDVSDITSQVITTETAKVPTSKPIEIETTTGVEIRTSKEATRGAPQISTVSSEISTDFYVETSTMFTDYVWDYGTTSQATADVTKGRVDVASSSTKTPLTTDKVVDIATTSLADITTASTDGQNGTDRQITDFIFTASTTQTPELTTEKVAEISTDVPIIKPSVTDNVTMVSELTTSQAIGEVLTVEETTYMVPTGVITTTSAPTTATGAISQVDTTTAGMETTDKALLNVTETENLTMSTAGDSVQLLTTVSDVKETTTDKTLTPDVTAADKPSTNISEVVTSTWITKSITTVSLVADSRSTETILVDDLVTSSSPVETTQDYMTTESVQVTSGLPSTTASIATTDTELEQTTAVTVNESLFIDETITEVENETALNVTSPIAKPAIATVDTTTSVPESSVVTRTANITLPTNETLPLTTIADYEVTTTHPVSATQTKFSTTTPSSLRQTEDITSAIFIEESTPLEDLTTLKEVQTSAAPVQETAAIETSTRSAVTQANITSASTEAVVHVSTEDLLFTTEVPQTSSYGTFLYPDEYYDLIPISTQTVLSDASTEAELHTTERQVNVTTTGVDIKTLSDEVTTIVDIISVVNETTPQTPIGDAATTQEPVSKELVTTKFDMATADNVTTLQDTLSSTQSTVTYTPDIATSIDKLATDESPLAILTTLTETKTTGIMNATTERTVTAIENIIKVQTSTRGSSEESSTRVKGETTVLPFTTFKDSTSNESIPESFARHTITVPSKVPITSPENLTTLIEESTQPVTVSVLTEALDLTTSVQSSTVTDSEKTTPLQMFSTPEQTPVKQSTIAASGALEVTTSVLDFLTDATLVESTVPIVASPTDVTEPAKEPILNFTSSSADLISSTPGVPIVSSSHTAVETTLDAVATTIPNQPFPTANETIVSTSTEASAVVLHDNVTTIIPELPSSSTADTNFTETSAASSGITITVPVVETSAAYQTPTSVLPNTTTKAFVEVSNVTKAFETFINQTTESATVLEASITASKTPANISTESLALLTTETSLADLKTRTTLSNLTTVGAPETTSEASTTEAVAREVTSELPTTEAVVDESTTAYYYYYDYENITTTTDYPLYENTTDLLADVTTSEVSNVSNPVETVNRTVTNASESIADLNETDVSVNETSINGTAAAVKETFVSANETDSSVNETVTSLDASVAVESDKTTTEVLNVSTTVDIVNRTETYASESITVVNNTDVSVNDTRINVTAAVVEETLVSLNKTVATVNKTVTILNDSVHIESTASDTTTTNDTFPSETTKALPKTVTAFPAENATVTTPQHDTGTTTVPSTSQSPINETTAYYYDYYEGNFTTDAQLTTESSGTNFL